MNGTQIHLETEGVKSNDPKPLDPSEIPENVFVKEEIIIPDDSSVIELESADSLAQAEEFQISVGDEDPGYAAQDEIMPDASPDILEPEPKVFFNNYEAWRKFKKMKFPKKKKNQVLEIYRDENYCTEDRYTDDEDFKY